MSNNSAKEPFYIHELPNGQYRPATEEEILTATRTKIVIDDISQQIANLTKRLEDMRLENCKHIVCYDVEGFPYNVRVCVACGKQSLL